MQTFEGKIAVVTGAASGIGKGLAEKCIAEGMSVVMADIEEDVLTKVAREFQEAGNNNVLAVKTDVSILEEIENLKQKALDTFGAVHLLFNNAGVSAEGNAWEHTQQDWEWVMGVNLWSVVHGIRAFVPQMIEQGDECYIVNTASAAGLLGGSTNASYAVTKHGVVALTEILYRDFASGNLNIGASVLCPGFINTNIMDSARNRQDRFADNREIIESEERAANLALFEEMLRNGMPPAELADIVFTGIRKRQLYIQTHDMFNDMIMARAENITKGNNPDPGLSLG